MEKGWNRRSLRKHIADLLDSPVIERLEAFRELPRSSAINALLGFLAHPEPGIKLRAVKAAGRLIADLAEENLEAGRVMIRRQLWNLTEESGACAFGAPELIGETLANSPPLAREFAPSLISLIMEEGNFLDFPPLLKGALWGIERLAEAQPELTKPALPYLRLLAEHPDLEIRAIADRIQATVE